MTAPVWLSQTNFTSSENSIVDLNSNDGIESEGNRPVINCHVILIHTAGGTHTLLDYNKFPLEDLTHSEYNKSWQTWGLEFRLPEEHSISCFSDFQSFC